MLDDSGLDLEQVGNPNVLIIRSTKSLSTIDLNEDVELKNEVAKDDDEQQGRQDEAMEEPFQLKNNESLEELDVDEQMSDNKQEELSEINDKP